MVNNTAMISYQYIPNNICTSLIKVEIDETTNTIHQIYILGGCHGNLIAIMKLLKGKDVD